MKPILQKFVIQNFENFIIQIFTTCNLFEKVLKEQVILFFNFIINSTVIIYKCLDSSDLQNAEDIEKLNLYNIFCVLTTIFTSDTVNIMKDVITNQITEDKIEELKHLINPLVTSESI